MFSGSGNTERLMGTLSDVWVCWKSNMAAINRKLIDSNVYLICVARIHESKEIPTVIPMVWGRATRLEHCEDCLMLVFVRNQMTTFNRK